MVNRETSNPYTIQVRLVKGAVWSAKGYARPSNVTTDSPLREICLGRLLRRIPVLSTLGELHLRFLHALQL